MLKRVLTIGAVVPSCSAPAMAGDLFEGMESHRMTVFQIDRASNRFMCAEHQHWMTVAAGELDGVHAGDIIRVSQHDSQPAHVSIVRTAAQEISSPEN